MSAIAKPRKAKLPLGKETDLTEAVVSYLNLLGIYAWRQNTGAAKFKGKNRDYFVRFGFPGISDVLGILPDGKFLAIETKRSDGVVSDSQRDFLGAVAKNKAVGFVAYTLDEVDRELRARGYIR